MVASILTQEDCAHLNGLLAQLASAASDTIASLIGREMSVTPVETALLDRDELISSLRSSYVVARGDLDHDYADRTMSVLISAQDAIALSGMLMMTPDDVIQQRRAAGVIEGEDAEAFGEVASVLFSGIGTVLRDEVANVDITLRDHRQIEPKGDTGDFFEAGSLLVNTFDLQVGDFPATKAFIVTDSTTAEAWNKGPLQTRSEPEGAEDDAARSEDDGFEGIPAAPIRGVLAAFVSQPEVYRTLRQSCRRVGLDLHRHGRGEIPNPAAHRDQIVLLDIPPGEDRQFDWCKRIKDFATDTRVVLLLHHPSRHRVTQAFLSKADAILGLPCGEPQLSQKLAAVLDAGDPVPSDEA